MKPFLLALFIFIYISSFSQLRLVTLGTSTTAGLATSSPDSSWVRRLNHFYKYQFTVLDTVYNLGVSGRNLYHAMPTSYIPPAGRPVSDPLFNVTRANTLLNGITTPADGVVILNFPTGGYDTYSIGEIMTALQIMYDSAVRMGNRCYVTTTQPRTDAGFNTSAVKRKLADIKDSILNRFGVARTINFWDDMFNPADTTIASAYSAGDNVHFNNAGHRMLFERVKAKNIFNLPAPAYRSNVNPTGLWSSASSWQIFNGSTWVSAVDPPSSGSGAITIINGDSIRINSFTEIDQLTIEPTGILAIFNTASTARAIATLSNGPGTDIENDGRLYVSSNGVLNGDGEISNNTTGNFILRNRGVLEVHGMNNGNMLVTNTGIIRNRTFTNNKTFVLQDLTLQLIASTFINNDSISIVSGTSTFIADSTLRGGFFTNASTGIIARHSTSGTTAFNNAIRVTNNGRIKGVGEYIFYNAVANTGSIEPGNNSGTLRLNPSFITGRSPILDIGINATGAERGVTYDNIILTDISPLTKNISGSRLRVTDRASDPVGTVYTIVSPLSGTIAGSFAEVILSPTLTGPNYHGGSFITVTKTSVMPVTWIGFSATAQNEKSARLNWSTAQESNTENFIIEHSTDGRQFIKIGSVGAAGNSAIPQHYQFLHEQPHPLLTNYYRLQQMDRDGRQHTSVTRTVSFRESTTKYISNISSTVPGQIDVQVTAEGLSLWLVDMSGKIIRKWSVQPGPQALSTGGIPAGVYVMAVYEKEKKIETHRVLLK